MASTNLGKSEVVRWIHEHIPIDSEILDVGACDGKWRGLLGEYPNMDACEIYAPNVHRINGMYRAVYWSDICDFQYAHYDLAIFGDVIEHLSIPRAQAVLEYAKQHASTIIVGVPFLYHQGPLYGNDHERHIQDDLTADLFEQRYPGFDVILMANNYCYYVWSDKR